MKTWHFIAYILIGIVVEYFLRLVFVGYSVLIVPELIIFLTILDLKNKKVLAKVILSALLYDFWISPRLGIVVIAMLLTLLVLYLMNRVSYLSDKKIKNHFLSNIINMTIFSDLLFLVYYVSSYFLTALFLGPGSDQTSWSRRLLAPFATLQIFVFVSLVFVVLYSVQRFSLRTKKFKI